MSPQAPSPPPASPGQQNHIDVDALMEDFAWVHFRDMLSIKKSGLDAFKGLERDDVEFVINRKKLVLIHSQPEYNGIQLTSTRPNTIFKSVFTNKTSQTQSYSLKTERTTESICGILREKGFTFGAEAELTLKTPCEIAELKTGFKHEVHFNSLTENHKSEALTWSVDNNIQVPSGGQTEASIIIEELNYHGSYMVTSTLSGMVTVSIKRIKDGVLVMPVCFNIVTMFQTLLNKNDARLKQGIVSVEKNTIVLKSKGSCFFQFALKQYVELTELQSHQHKDYSAEMSRMNIFKK